MSGTNKVGVWVTLSLKPGTRDEAAAVIGEALEAAQIFQTNELMYETLLMFQGIFGLKPAFGWTSEYGHTLDGLPAIGPHRFFPHRHSDRAVGHRSAGSRIARGFQGARLGESIVFASKR